MGLHPLEEAPPAHWAPARGRSSATHEGPV